MKRFDTAREGALKEMEAREKRKNSRVFLVVGCPGSGKSWVCDQLKDGGKFNYVHHDLYVGMAGPKYVDAIRAASAESSLPILAEAPFSISQIKGPLEEDGFQVEPVFIQEHPDTITGRYRAREKKDIPKGHLTRQQTYAQRADAWGSFKGTSEQVLKHLKEVV